MALLPRRLDPRRRRSTPTAAAAPASDGGTVLLDLENAIYVEELAVSQVSAGNRDDVVALELTGRVHRTTDVAVLLHLLQPAHIGPLVAGIVYAAARHPAIREVVDEALRTSMRETGGD